MNLKVELQSAGYLGTPVLQRCAFELAGPGATFVTGPNGVGKSTLARALAGTCDCEGSARLDGIELLTLRPDQRVRQGLVTLPQQDRLFPNLTLRDHYRLSADGPLMRAHLKRLTVEDLPEKRQVNLLSGGQKTSVAIAFALAFSPKVLVLDEPAAGLDRESRCRLTAALSELSTTVRLIIIEHETKWLEQATDSIIEFAAGPLSASTFTLRPNRADPSERSI